MGRVTISAAAAVIGVFSFTGCGSDATVAGNAAQAPDAITVQAVEPTDGRIGDATLQRPGAPEQQLSRGGRPDVGRRGDSPRRDGVGAGAACPNPGLAAGAATLPAVSTATLCLLNGERADQGLPPLTPNTRLTEVAKTYAADLVAGSYFSHTGRDGSSVLSRIKRSGYIPPNGSWVLGENLAWGTGALATPEAIMRAWMNSPGHRENILNPDFREVGVGVVTGNPRAADGLGGTFATEFGAIDGKIATVVQVRHSAKQSRDRAAKARKRARRERNARSARHARAALRRSAEGRDTRAGKVRRVSASLAN